MTNAVAEKTLYEIHGYYFGEEKRVTSDTRFCHSNRDSMIDHQKAWYEEAKKNGHQSGELDEIQIIKSNYNGTLTDEQLLAITNDRTLMDTPFGELFPTKINAFVIELLQSECAELETYVRHSETEKDCSEEISRIHAIQREIAVISCHRDKGRSLTQAS